jgi:uncharacterized repeat protein (TIGR03803 family)
MLRKQFSINVNNICAIALLTLLLIAAAAQPAQAQTFTIVHAFASGTDGAVPNAIIRDAQGNLYGTTEFGGDVSCGDDTCGTVFKIDSTGSETVLFSFDGGNGSDPVAGLVEDAAGNLYGTTRGNGFIGGASVVFKLAPNGQETTLFIADTLNVTELDSPVAVDAQGNIYGMSPYGGVPNCSVNTQDEGCGTLFKLSPAGKLTVLHVFNGNDGMQPEGGLVLDAEGNLYGSTYFGGNLSCTAPGFSYPEPGCGTIYKVASNGKFSVLHTFNGPGDGSFPLGLIIDSGGNLYGIAQSGGDDIAGTNWEYGIGTIFKVTRGGLFSVLYTFQPCNDPPCTQGQVRNAVYGSHLIRDSKGNLYGLEQSNDCALAGGCLIKLDTKGNLTDLYDFEGENAGPDGYTPVSVVQGSGDDFYGSMWLGGPPDSGCGGEFTNGCGTVFHLAF